ncbi:SDR family oxidoreductase [Nocardia sp. NPDC003482]
MRVFVTGPSGHIGSAVIPELVKAGHEVVGLARSESSAEAVRALGAEVRRGDLSDLDGLRAAATAADAVVHLGFKHDDMRAGDFAGAVAADLAVVRTFGDALAGTGKTFMGVGLAQGDTEENDAAIRANPRSEVARTIAEFATRGIRPLLIGIPPVVHSNRDRHGFIPILIETARRTGVSAYVGDGANRWPAVHTLDLAHLYRLALEHAPTGAQLPAAAEEGVRVRDIADTIARHLDIPTRSLEPAESAAHFGYFGAFVTMNMTMPPAAARELLEWRPTHPDLIADLDEGHYFARP